eukprot:TRINITY_DN33854_c0_g1_i1.p2 TRINITY_DN33854_c0_g1~~TRINITY_DN33854_c0_g1_i1.p2  ORF type:complete len:129 (-),score=24.35 TRINITY_DN33854_c0_g1_i1:122-508(-)
MLEVWDAQPEKVHNLKELEPASEPQTWGERGESSEGDGAGRRAAPASKPASSDVAGNLGRQQQQQLQPQRVNNPGSGPGLGTGPTQPQPQPNMMSPQLQRVPPARNFDRIRSSSRTCNFSWSEVRRRK